MTSLDELEALARAATQGEWEWTIHDYSMASLGVGRDPGMGTPLVLNVSPCRSCMEHEKRREKTEWEWGRCTTPSEQDAAYIAAAHPARVLSLIAEVRRLREDKERLDYLDKANRRLNAKYGTAYKWRVIMNHNVNRLMLGPGKVDLNDMEANGLPSCRDAIDEARARTALGDTNG